MTGPPIRRRLPRWSDLRPYLRRPPRARSSAERRVAGAASVADLRPIARRHVPRAVFDYVDGGAEEELSLARARQAFGRVEFVPSVLRGVADVDPSTTILGAPASLPLVFAPTGFTRLMHHAGEPAVARAAARAGIPYALSTLGTTSPERLAADAPDGRRWFQLYVWRDRDAVAELVARAAGAGFEALILTVDTPVAGARLRDVRNGFSIPPALTLRTLADISVHPGWWLNLLTTDPITFASFRSSDGTVAELLDTVLDPGLDWDDLAWLRGAWTGPLVIKGIQSVEDAQRAADHGVDAIVLSNHGGRQLDRAPVPLELLPSVVAAVGERVEVYVDGGVLSGADVVAAVGLGARACLVGRAYLYGLMAGGEAGVDRVAALLRADVIRTMRLLGVRSVPEVTPERARLRPI
ncbi:MAG TPA: alpha-hydroxy acid oxidase [Candidatus Limnocylindrales bacterium]|nr:alpha-hydroxy acid oxidase [Candidatus Limnocylindrales bacterium]